MTNEEAIRILEDGAWWAMVDILLPCDSAASMAFHDAIDMAIAALRAQQEPMKPLGGEAAPGISGPEARPREGESS